MSGVKVTDQPQGHHERVFELDNRWRARLACIDYANRFNSPERSLEDIMRHAEKFQAFVFQTGDYAEQASPDAVAE